MKESNFWKQIKSNLPTNCFATRIENRHGCGIPDTHIVWDGLSFWLELKTTKNNTINISPAQIAWNTAYSLRGGLGLILVRPSKESSILLFGGHDARDLAHSGLDLDPLFRASSYQELFNFIRDSFGSGSGSGFSGRVGSDKELA